MSIGEDASSVGPEGPRFSRCHFMMFPGIIFAHFCLTGTELLPDFDDPYHQKHLLQGLTLYKCNYEGCTESWWGRSPHGFMGLHTGTAGDKK